MRKLALTLALAVGMTAPAFADIVKCQQGIDKNGAKLQSSIIKALTKCEDGYRKAKVALTPLATTAASCQTGLDKAINFGNIVSAISKTKNSLAKLVPPLGTACTDADLAALGYLTEASFGDRWQRLILMAALKGSFDTQQLLISDFPNILSELGANGCALCATLGNQFPCVSTVCDVDTPNSPFETKVLTAPVGGNLVGNTVVAGCEWQNVMPNGEIALIATPNLGLRPVVVLGNTVCNGTFRSMGYLACNGSSTKVNFSACQDSDTSDGDECVGTVCQASPAAGTGGACLTYTSLPASAAGDAYILSTTRLRISSANGGDGVVCTPDDTYTATPAAVIPTTTGSATAQVLDYNNTNGSTQTEGPIVGAPVSGGASACANARSGSSTGLILAGAFPGADTVGGPLGDTVTRVTIKCQ
jgi:hypothetical protein